MAKVKIPATTANLGPGFDSLGMALKLYNYVEMGEIPEGLEIDIEGEGADVIARDETNVVYEAAKTVFAKAGRTPKGLAIRLINNIPVARGLGSSAAALVGGVMAANCLLGEPLDADTLLQIAVEMEGHPDNVAPAFLGGVVVSAFMDGKVVCRKIATPEGLLGVVAIPHFHVSTAEARGVLPASIPMSDAVYNLSRSSLLVTAFANNDFNLLASVMHDRLHQPYRTGLIPGLQTVFEAAREAGALGVALSGSGPTVIAFTQERPREVARAMADAFHQYKVECTVKLVDPCGEGAKVVG